MSFKTGGDELFQLVKSLKQAEKRYFKVFASQQVKGEKNNYVKLFEALDRQEVYDEKRLIRQLPGLPSAKLTATRHYLQGLILKSLRNYYSELSVDSRLRDMLADAEILFSKSQYRACAKTLSRAEELAHKHGKYVAVIDVCRWQRRLVNVDLSPGPTVTHEEVLAKEQRALELLKNINEYRELYLKCDKLRRETNALARNEGEFAQFSELIRSTLLEDESRALTFESRSLFWSIKGICHLGVREPGLAYESEKRFLALFEEEPHQLMNHFSNYIVALNNVAYTCYSRREYAEAASYIAKLRAVPEQYQGQVNEKARARIFSFSGILELNMLIDTGNFSKGSELLDDLERGLKVHDALLDHEHKLAFYYNISYLCFAVGSYKKAIHYLNTLINCSSEDYRHELDAFARILLLITHYELGNTDLIHYLVKSTHRFLYSRQRLYKYETVVLNRLRKLPGTHNSREMLTFFQDFRDELLLLTNDPFESKAFDYFDMIAWLESKIQRRPFGETFRQRLENVPLE